jgi:spore maturation protein SpmA
MGACSTATQWFGGGTVAGDHRRDLLWTLEMLNAVWVTMIVGALLCGALTGTLEEVARASTDSARRAVELVVGLIGVMAFWLGLMRVLEQGGLLASLARALRPVTRWLFPDVPADHPATGMIIMNFAANMMGLGNAATPFGLKAMVELEKLNPHPGSASNSMALFLAINTSNLALLPTGIIALRASLGSESPGSIILPTILATSCSTLVAIVAAKSLQGRRAFRPAPADRPTTEAPVSVSLPEPSAPEPARSSSALSRWVASAMVIASVLALGFALVESAGEALPSGEPLGLAGAAAEALTDWPLVVLLVAIVLYGVSRGVDVFSAVADGGREAFQIALRFVSFFIAIMVAIGVFRASGALDYLVAALDPVTGLVGMPGEALPMALLRPLSGKGAYAMAAGIMEAHGPDSLVGQIVSTMQGSTETTFYVLALYFGVAGVRRPRHTVAACLIADVAGILGAVWACHLFS